MPRLPVVSGRAAVRAFERAGWVPVHQRGSHITMTKPGVNAKLSIPNHRELGKGTLHNLVSQAGLTRAEFVALLRR